ncbi:hypothetical protein H4219_004329 [Mycoemilia scoparia]|uniref:AAA+ ATPase domain-containing protein n=1 Tax=Mycoemilia scoparia TaxID=417184 RepID=A0A9W7ZS23_9FUNG|nr:hypothetical protein H4219_004329 [Mycoemilia scoparia]
MIRFTKWPLEDDLQSAIEISRRCAFAHKITSLFPLFIFAILWELDSHHLQSVMQDLNVDIALFTKKLDDTVKNYKASNGRWSKTLSGIGCCIGKKAVTHHDQVELNKGCKKILDKALELEMASQAEGGFGRGHSSSFRFKPNSNYCTTTTTSNNTNEKSSGGFRVIPRFEVDEQSQIKISRHGFIIAMLHHDSAFQSLLKTVSLSPTIFESAVRTAALQADTTEGDDHTIQSELSGLTWFVRDIVSDIKNTDRLSERSLIGRRQELEDLCNMISNEAKSSILLVGEPGTGKSALIEGLAAQIAKHPFSKTKSQPSKSSCGSSGYGATSSISVSDSETAQNNSDNESSTYARSVNSSMTFGTSSSAHRSESIKASTGLSHIYSFNIPLFLSTLPTKPMICEALDTLANICTTRNAMIVIDPLDLVLGHRGSSETQKTAAGFLNANSGYGFTTLRQHIKYLMSVNSIRIIGGVRPEIHHKFIIKEAHFSKCTKPMFIDSASHKDTLDLLKVKKRQYEITHDIKIDSDTLPLVIELAHRYEPNPVLPATALKLLDIVCTNTRFDMYYWIYWLQELDLHRNQTTSWRHSHRITKLFGKSGQDTNDDNRSGPQQQPLKCTRNRPSLSDQQDFLSFALAQPGLMMTAHGSMSKKEISSIISGAIKKYQPWLDANLHRTRYFNHIFGSSPSKLNSQDLAFRKEIENVYHKTRGEHCPITIDSSFPRSFSFPKPSELGHVTVNSVLLDPRILTFAPLSERLRTTKSRIDSLEISLKESARSQIAAVEQIVKILNSVLKPSLSESLIYNGTIRPNVVELCKPRAGPLASMLLVGPKGVGKTFLAQSLAHEHIKLFPFSVSVTAEAYYNQNSSTNGGCHLLVRELDDNVLAKQVREHPFSTALIQDIDQAHPEVQAEFAKILKTGFMSDSEGHRVDFRNTIMIFEISLAKPLLQPHQHQQVLHNTIMPLTSRTSVSSLSSSSASSSFGQLPPLLNKRSIGSSGLRRPSFQSLAGPLLSSLRSRKSTNNISIASPPTSKSGGYALPPPLPSFSSSIYSLLSPPPPQKPSATNSNDKEGGWKTQLIPDLHTSIDYIIPLAPLTQTGVLPIAKRLIEIIETQRQVQIIMEPGVYDFIIDQSFDPSLGISSIQNHLNKSVDAFIDNLYANGCIKQGATICIYCDLGSESGLNYQILAYGSRSKSSFSSRNSSSSSSGYGNGNGTGGGVLSPNQPPQIRFSFYNSNNNNSSSSSQRQPQQIVSPVL